MASSPIQLHLGICPRYEGVIELRQGNSSLALNCVKELEKVTEMRWHDDPPFAGVIQASFVRGDTWPINGPTAAPMLLIAHGRSFSDGLLCLSAGINMRVAATATHHAQCHQRRDDAVLQEGTPQSAAVQKGLPAPQLDRASLCAAASADVCEQQ